MNFKNCIVPMCKTTSIKFPKKMFFHVPKDEARRKKWCLIMRRASPLSVKTTCYVCEDHFDIEKDVENYMRYKFLGGYVYLKKDVVPHKFDCQKSTIVKKRTTGERRRRLEIITPLLKESLSPVTTTNTDCNPTTSVETSLNNKSTKLENDMENYWECRLTDNAKQHRLKAGVLPHVFECQKEPPVPESGYARKRKVFDTRDQSDILSDSSVTNILVMPPTSLLNKVDKGVQVFIRHPYRSKGINVSVPMRSTSTSPMEIPWSSPKELETDVENYVKYKLTGGKVYLKKNVLPHKFECQTSYVSRKSPERKRKRLRDQLTEHTTSEDETDSADEGPSGDKNSGERDFDVTYRSNDSQNEDMILPDVENRVEMPSSSALLPSFPVEWSKRPGSTEGYPDLKIIKQEVPDESNSASDFYDYPKPENCEASLTVVSEDQFDKFGKHIACQLRELPLRNALMLQETIQSLITKERIACLPEDGVTK